MESSTDDESTDSLYICLLAQPEGFFPVKNTDKSLTIQTVCVK